MKKIFSYFPTLIFLIFLLVLWEAIVDIFTINPQILPSPSEIFSAYITNALLLIPHITQTLLETVWGLLLSIVFGTSIAIVLRLSSLGRKIVYPLLIISQTIPIIALAPLFLIWFGFTILPKIIIVTLACFFPITIAFADGMEKSNPQIIKLLQSMGASRLQILFMAEIPGALPSFFSGLRIAAAYCVTGAIVGEYVGGYEGLGIFMQSAAHSYATAEVFVTIVIASLLSIILFSLVFVFEYFLLPWHRKEKSRLSFL
jgi:ABC-type nitrate/sulfonate/bicarbonate transport system permease component